MTNFLPLEVGKAYKLANGSCLRVVGQHTNRNWVNCLLGTKGRIYVKETGIHAFNTWAHVVGFWGESNEPDIEPARAVKVERELGPVKPKPVVCPEVWADKGRNVDYMAAVRAMCKG